MNVTDECLTAMRDTVPDDDALSTQTIDRARIALIGEIAAAPPVRARRRPRVAFALTLTAAAAIAAMIVTLPHPGPKDRALAPPAGPPAMASASPSAQTLLFRAARDVINQPWHPLAPGEWEYYRVELGYTGRDGRASRAPSFVEDEWLSGDGGARVIQYSGHDVLLIGSARKQLSVERGRQQRTTHFQVETQDPPWPPSLGFTYRQIVSLPSAIGQLRRWIDRHAPAVGGPGEMGTFAFIQSLVIDPRISPRVAASLFQLIARLPHVALIGNVRDPLGRPGVAVGFTDTLDTQTQVIFDATTGQTLAVRQASLGEQRGDPPRGTVESWIAVSARAIVPSDHERP